MRSGGRKVVQLVWFIATINVGYRQLESERNTGTRLQQQVEKISLDLEGCLADLEANKISNLLLRQQVGVVCVCVFG